MQKLNDRFNVHRTGFKHPNKHGFCKILFQHFHDGNCKGAYYKVQYQKSYEIMEEHLEILWMPHALLLKSYITSTGC